MKTLPLFTRTSRPEHHDDYGLGERWFELSPSARRLLLSSAHELARIELSYVNIARSAYPTTMRPKRLESALIDSIAPFATWLLRTRVGRRPLFLTSAIPYECSSDAFYRFMVLVAEAMRLQARTRPYPWYFEGAPSPRDGGFPLHSDLHARRRLLLIYDRLPMSTAQSLLMPKLRFGQVLNEIGVSRATVRRLQAMLADASGRDMYNPFISALYGAKWSRTRDVARHLAERATVVPFLRGEGYMLNDRLWLHGRRNSQRPITVQRFRRILF